MKKYLFLICVLFLTTRAHAQLKIVEQPKSVEIGRLIDMSLIKIIHSDNNGISYLFSFQDNKYKQIQKSSSFGFLDDENDTTLNDFYDLIMKSFENPPKDGVKVEFEDYYVTLLFDKFYGAKTVQFRIQKKGSSISSYSNIKTKKQMTKLFGKKKSKKKNKHV